MCVCGVLFTMYIHDFTDETDGVYGNENIEDRCGCSNISYAGRRARTDVLTQRLDSSSVLVTTSPWFFMHKCMSPVIFLVGNYM